MLHLIEKLLSILLTCVLVFLFICIFLGIPISKYYDRIEQAEKMIDSGSKVYLDGEEVNPNFIVLKEYKITIRDNIVILSD